MRLTAAALLVALAAARASAQQFGETIEVAIANLDVVIVDANGRVVSDLTKDEFELRVNGKPIEITNFSAYFSRAVMQEAAPKADPAAHGAALQVLQIEELIEQILVQQKRAAVHAFRDLVTIASSIDGKVAMLLVGARPANPWGVVVHAYDVKESRRAKIEIDVPLAAVLFAENRAQLTFHFALRDAKGNFYQLDSRELTLESRMPGVHYEIELALPRGKHELSVTVAPVVRLK